MSPRSSWSLCGLHLSSVGVLAVILYFIDMAIAQDENYDDSQVQAYAPGQDYPIYTEVPQGLSFTCDDKIPGYYADPETMCQVWHWCVPGLSGNIMYSFVCGPGTVFNQQTRVCDWFFKVDCANSAAFYSINEDLYKDEAGNFIAGKKGNSYNSEYDKRRLAARRKRMDNIQKSHTKRHTDIQNNHTKRRLQDRGTKRYTKKEIQSIDF